MTPEKRREVKRWANELRSGVPNARKVPEEVRARQETAYRDRVDTAEWLFQAFCQRAPAVPLERLRAAISGDEVYGRIPLAFPSAELYSEFRRGLGQLCKEAGVTDVTIQVVGSSVNGWRTNPQKPLAAWTELSDLDLAVFSVDALNHARDIGVPVNESVILDNEYVILKNEVDGHGFYDTPFGSRLEEFARGWSDLLGVAVDFKLNLRTRPFGGGATIIERQS